MVTCLFVTEAKCVQLPFSENPHSAEDELYPRMKADEVQWAVLDSEDTMVTAFCNRDRSIEIDLLSGFGGATDFAKVEFATHQEIHQAIDKSMVDVDFVSIAAKP
jgi:hypothetical protein